MMKKIVLACGIAAAILGATTGCSNSSSSSNGASTGFGDSLSTYLGTSQGYRLGSDYNTLSEADKKSMRKDEILRGVKQMVMTDTTQQAYITGVQIGLSLAQQLYRYESAGIAVDRAKVFQAYAAAFSADTVSMEALREAQTTFQTLAQEAQQKMMAYYDEQQKAEREARANSPEAKENAKKGADYIAAEKAKDPSIVTTPSGLSYKVVTEGTGEPVGENGRAVVAYKGSLVDGTTFDANEEGIEFSPRGVVPGFGEALKMMKKGSHYVIYIPGELAYGIDGVPQAGIGPNATLIFDLEVKDIVK